MLSPLLVMLLFIIILINLINKVISTGYCETDLDCSLNGDCINNKCICDIQWNNSLTCNILNFDITPINNGYHNNTQASWGGNVIYEDNKYHLFVSQFINSCPLQYWSSASMIVRAESVSYYGPFKFMEIVIPTFSHNPTIRKGFDGYYYLYMIGDGSSTNPPDCTNNNQTNINLYLNNNDNDDATFATGIYVSRATSVYGPWSAVKPIVFTEKSEYLCAGHTNPSPHFNPDGSVYLAFQASQCDPEHHYWASVGLAIADTWDSPYSLVSPDPVTPHDYSPIHPFCVAGVDEDPFLWRSKRGFHIITHGMCPSGVRQAHYKYSTDGVTWITSPVQTYHYTVYYNDGTQHTFARVERPQLEFATRDDSTGYYSDPIALFNGVCGTGIGSANNHSDYECVFDKMTGMTWTLSRPLITEI